jgi:hypothetical protein
MCGPADYHALQTCILRIAALSIAGIVTYAAHRVIRFLKNLQRENPTSPDARVLP